MSKYSFALISILKREESLYFKSFLFSLYFLENLSKLYFEEKYNYDEVLKLPALGSLTLINPS